MRTIETTFETFGASVLLLGFKGDSNATEILIDCEDALTEYQGTMAALSITGPDLTVYPGDISLDEDGVVHWVVAARDCGIAGHGSVRIDLVDDAETVVASAEASTIIMKTNMKNIAPDQIADWTEAASVALQELKSALLDLYDGEDTTNASEAARRLAETGRVNAEMLRVSAESARVTAESARVTAENARATAETARATAETARATAETARATAETARASAEAARVSEFSTIEANAQAALSYIGPSEDSSTASAAHAAGSYFIYDGKLYKATVDIAIGDTITSGTNCAQVSGGAMGEVSDFKSAFSQMANIPDSIRENNMLENSQYSTDQTNHGVTVHAVPYSGYALSGEIANNGIAYLSKSNVSFVSGRKYTMVVCSRDISTGVRFGFRTSSGWVKDSDDTAVATGFRNETLTFTAYDNYADCYLAIVNTTGSAIPLSYTYYVYLFEGEYSLEEISVSDKILSYSFARSFNDSNFVNSKIGTIAVNGWQRLEYSDAQIYQDMCYMDDNGDIVHEKKHCVLKISDAYGICRLRFQTKNLASGAMFIVKDSTGTTRKVYKFSSGWNNSYKNINLYFVIPGGLPAGATIYMNWYNKNYAGHTDDYIDHVDIQYEKAIKGSPAGRDLFDREEAIEDGGMYFEYTSGVQVKSDTYCSGEVKVKAGDVITFNKNSHLSYFDAYGNYLSGEVTAGSYTVPANTNGAMLSFKATDAPIYYVGRNDHFTIPINQNVITQGEDTASAVDNESNMVNVNAICKIPMSYTSDGEPTPLVVIVHGSGYGVSATEWGTANNGAITSDSYFNALTNTFLNNGYAVCDINGYDNSAPNNTWGSQRGVMAYRKLIDYVLTKYNMSSMVNIYGFSMGGLVALNFLNMNADIVKCAAIASPVVALYDQVFNGGNANWKSQMMTSYGFDGTSWDDNASLTVGYDPFTRVVTIDSKKYNLTDYPFMRIWHGTSDSATSPTKSAEFVEFVRNSGKDCTYRAVTGADHGICYGASEICNNEYLYWFNRFNKKG